MLLPERPSNQSQNNFKMKGHWRHDNNAIPNHVINSILKNEGHTSKVVK